VSKKNHRAKTFPAFFPLLAMDRIYTRGFSIGNVDVMTDSTWKSLSDHCAIVADVQLISASPEDTEAEDTERMPC